MKKNELKATFVIVLIILLNVSLATNPRSSDAANIIAGPALSIGTTAIREGQDFATMELGIPWNMSAGPYPDFPTVLGDIDRGTFNVTAGTWDMTTTGNDVRVWLLPSSIANTQKVLRLGDTRPILASDYSLLSFHLCSDLAGTSNILWFRDQSPHTQYAESAFINIATGCNLYTVDLDQINVLVPHGGVTDWSGQMQGLRLDPISQSSGVSLQLDWARLTSKDTSLTVSLNWTDVNSGTDLYFYLNDVCSITDAMPIGMMSRGGLSNGVFNWGASLQPNIGSTQPYPLPESFEPGMYTVLMRIDGAGPAICASDVLEIRPAPILNFVRPSLLSGPDYGKNVVNDPWGMANSEDIELEVNIASSSFIDGIYQATNSNSDPNIHLNLLSDVDASVYKNVSFRLNIEGIQNIGAGWISRVVWWYVNSADAVVSQDILLYEGWHTYSLDLGQALIEPSNPGTWSGSPTEFRLDLHEIPTPNTFNIDYILLTGEEQVSAGSLFPIIYDVNPPNGVGMTFYYDSDRDLGNGGRVPMVQYPSSTYQIFIPFGAKNYDGSPVLDPEIDIFKGDRFWWDTTSVPVGTYYVSVDLFDGLNTTTWYSEVPINITN